jgi:hypothetical protein
MDLLCKLFAGSYENLWKAIIRPTRDNYSSKDLGPYKFELKSKNYKRTDIIIHNKRNLKLKCSFWEPFDEEREYDQLPCVIYLHGNSSSRLEALGQLKYLLPLNITVFAFDFSGSGKSEGDYISLGWHESDDVDCVINFLKKTNKVSTIGLWGRSMGAVTALIYGSKENNNLSAILLDSAFYSLKKLIEELIEKSIKIPNFIANSIIEKIRNTILEKANFDLMDIEPYAFAEKCFLPALFCHAENDSLINIHHCYDLYNIYPGEKEIYTLNGDHNTTRDKEFKHSASLFFYHNLNLNDLKNNIFENNEININNFNNFNDINDGSFNNNKNLYYSCKSKRTIKIYNNEINDEDENSFKDNINEKNENEKGNITDKSNTNIIGYFQKCSSNDLNEINKQNKKLLLSSEIKDILKLSQNYSFNNIKKSNELKMKPILDLKKIKKIPTSSSSQNIYFKKNVHNPFTKVHTKINPIVNNCNLLNEMSFIKSKFSYNNRYNNLDNTKINTNHKHDLWKDKIKNINKNNTLNNKENFYRKNIANANTVTKSSNIDYDNKNPFSFKLSLKNSTENEKQQKAFFHNFYSKSHNLKSINDYKSKQNCEKRWVIFEGINPYLKENKDYFKKKILKKESIVDDDNTIRNDETFVDLTEENSGEKKIGKNK